MDDDGNVGEAGCAPADDSGLALMGVHDVRTAVLLSQAVVAGAGVENQGTQVFQRVGEADDRLRAHVGNDEGGSAFDVFFDLCNQFSNITVLNDRERELLLEEPPGRIVVVDGEPCTGNAVICRRNIEK